MAMAVVTILLGAALAWLSTFYFQYQKDRGEQKRLLTVIFGELLNIRRHYAYSSNEVPTAITARDEMLPVEMSTYGDLSFTKSDLTRLGFLNNQDIADLIQLSLKIRNTDLALKHALDHFSSDMNTPFDMQYAKSRMRYVSSVVDRIIKALVERNPNLKDITPDIEELDHTL